MEPNSPPQSSNTLSVESLQLQVMALQSRLNQLQQDKSDLETMLDMVTQHSDTILLETQQEKQDLELLLETTAEHADAVEFDFYNQATEAKRQIEEQFQLIAEATPVGLMISRIADGQILYVNAAVCEMVHLEAAQLLQRKTVEFYSQPEDRQHIVSVLLNQQFFQGELPCVRADETPFWALVSFRPFVFKGEATILTAMNDITARKAAEESLRLAEERYRSIFDNALEGIFQATPEGAYIRVNPAMAAIHGYESPADLIENIPLIWEKKWVNVQRQQQYRQQLSQAGQVQDFEYQCYRQDGRLIWVEENSRLIRDSQGKVLYYEGIVQEITDRKRSEEALQKKVRKLQVEIDQVKREREVKQISQTDYFQNLISEVDDLRFPDDN